MLHNLVLTLMVLLSPGESAPRFTLKSVGSEGAGKENFVALDSFVGADATDAKKAVLVSFIASSCDSCKKSVAYLAALQDLYRSKGLQVLLINTDAENDKQQSMRSFTKEANAHFPLLADRFRLVAKRYSDQALPGVYLIGADGAVVLNQPDANDDNARQLLDQVRKSLGERSTDPIPEVLTKFIAQAKTSDFVLDLSFDPTMEDLVAPQPAKKKRRVK